MGSKLVENAVVVNIEQGDAVFESFLPWRLRPFGSFRVVVAQVGAETEQAHGNAGFAQRTVCHFPRQRFGRRE